MAGRCPFRPGQTARTQSVALPEGLSQKVADVNQQGQQASTAVRPLRPLNLPDRTVPATIKGFLATPRPPSRGRRSTRRWRLAALVWVDWFNMRRLLGPIGDIPPAVFEAQYYQRCGAREDSFTTRCGPR